MDYVNVNTLVQNRLDPVLQMNAVILRMWFALFVWNLSFLQNFNPNQYTRSKYFTTQDIVTIYVF